MGPDFEKDFILYTFASDNSYARVLTQKKTGDEESSHIYEFGI